MFLPETCAYSMCTCSHMEQGRYMHVSSRQIEGLPQGLGRLGRALSVEFSQGRLHCLHVRRRMSSHASAVVQMLLT